MPDSDVQRASYYSNVGGPDSDIGGTYDSDVGGLPDFALILLLE